ncbi:hypothetical protein Tco_0770289 [Tanacetum coccineum]|uniref:Retrotransposon gag domain-containing protein n=1 Tax=Tanacetum coccineum TaxID=301880 RepID=A0ABQ4ZFN6_9ASTR
MQQGRALTWWNTLVQTQGWAAAIVQPREDFKKLLMEEYCPNDEIQSLKQNSGIIRWLGQISTGIDDIK